MNGRMNDRTANGNGNNTFGAFTFVFSRPLSAASGRPVAVSSATPDSPSLPHSPSAIKKARGKRVKRQQKTSKATKPDNFLAFLKNDA